MRVVLPPHIAEVQILSDIEGRYEGRSADDEPEEDVEYHSPEIACLQARHVTIPEPVYRSLR